MLYLRATVNRTFRIQDGMFLWRSLRPDALTILLGYLARAPQATADVPADDRRAGAKNGGFPPKFESKDR
jgi:hypothetical protein